MSAREGIRSVDDIAGESEKTKRAFSGPNNEKKFEKFEVGEIEIGASHAQGIGQS